MICNFSFYIQNSFGLYNFPIEKLKYLIDKTEKPKIIYFCKNIYSIVYSCNSGIAKSQLHLECTLSISKSASQ